jgi:hypothetical protein
LYLFMHFPPPLYLPPFMPSHTVSSYVFFSFSFFVHSPFISCSLHLIFLPYFLSLASLFSTLYLFSSVSPPVTPLSAQFSVQCPTALSEESVYGFTLGAEVFSRWNCRAARRLNITQGYFMQYSITFPPICLSSFFTALDPATVLSADQHYGLAPIERMYSSRTWLVVALL